MNAGRPMHTMRLKIPGTAAGNHEAAKLRRDETSEACRPPPFSPVH